MNHNPFLSVIIPIYNTETYLPDCIESIIKQDFSDYEILLVDDGSTDNSSAICDNYAAKYSHIHCIHQPNSGHTAARQAGFMASQGEYIAFVDSDDWISPVMFSNLCRIAQESDVDIVHCNFTAIMPNGEKTNKVPFLPGYYDKAKLTELVYPKMIYSGTWFTFGAEPNLWNKLFRRSLLEKYLFRVPKDISIGEDWLTSYPCMLQAKSIYFTEQAYYFYRSRSDSLKHHISPNRLQDLHLLLAACAKALDVEHYPMMANQVDYFSAYQSMQTLTAVFQDMLHAPKSSNPAKKSIRALFLEECNNPHIRRSFRTVKINDINGYHNKLYAFCIRYRLYLLFRIALSI